MKSERVLLRGMNDEVSIILDQTERFSDKAGINNKEMLRVRLLAEELINLINAMKLDFEAEFWIVKEAEFVRLNLELRTLINPARKKEFMSLSRSGSVPKAKGIVGKIRSVVENMMVTIDEADQIQSASMQGVPYAMYGMMDAESARMVDMATVWSLQRYRDQIEVQDTEEVQESRDELEKSVIANLADDVGVGIKNSRVSIVVTYKIAAS